MCFPGSNSKHDAEKFNVFLETLLHNRVIADGTLAVDSIRVKVRNNQ